MGGWVGGWVDGRVAGNWETITNSVSAEAGVEAWAELGKIPKEIRNINFSFPLKETQNRYFYLFCFLI